MRKYRCYKKFMWGDHEKNIAKANEYAREEALKGNCAIAPHCVFTQFLDDEVPEERSLGQEMGKELLCRCDELLVCGSIISEGMREEIKTAYENGITVASFRKECVRKSKLPMRTALLF